MYIMFDTVNTPFTRERRLIVCKSLQEFSKTKESTLRMILILSIDTEFLLCGAELLKCILELRWNHLMHCHRIRCYMKQVFCFFFYKRIYNNVISFTHTHITKRDPVKLMSYTTFTHDYWQVILSTVL